MAPVRLRSRNSHRIESIHEITVPPCSKKRIIYTESPTRLTELDGTCEEMALREPLTDHCGRPDGCPDIATERPIGRGGSDREGRRTPGTRFRVSRSLGPRPNRPIGSIGSIAILERRHVRHPRPSTGPPRGPLCYEYTPVTIAVPLLLLLRTDPTGTSVEARRSRTCVGGAGNHSGELTARWRTREAVPRVVEPGGGIGVSYGSSSSFTGDHPGGVGDRREIGTAVRIRTPRGRGGRRTPASARRSRRRSRSAG